MRPENIQAWAECVEFGHPPPSQPPFDQFGTPLAKTQKATPFNFDLEAHLNYMRKQNAVREALEPVSRQQQNPLPATQKTGPSSSDVEAHLNFMIRQNTEREALARVTRQRKILFPNSVPKDPKPEPRPYQIPRKPVPKCNDTTPRPPQAVLLKNGETKRLDKLSTYAERVRDLGYPEALCPLPITEAAANNTRGVDSTDAKVVKQKDDSQICHLNEKLNTPGYTDSSHTPQDPSLTPEPSPSSGDALALRHAQAANPNSVPKATPSLEHIDKPPIIHSTSSMEHLLNERKMRRLSVGSNLSRSDAVR